LSFPVGFAADGLPIGAQLLGPDFSEATLLRIGRAYEIATQSESWRQRRPPINGSG
jgi:Asp-tRNA(Asn)/Glu-tRNA(Gln) amidotransferase A subunit family amidase